MNAFFQGQVVFHNENRINHGSDAGHQGCGKNFGVDLPEMPLLVV
jgi:hypothetical protein